MKLFWTDIETTGLKIIDDILEIAIWESDLTTPFEAKPIYHTVLSYDRPTLFIDEFVREMHTKNGLFEECRASNKTLFDVAMDLRDLIPIVADREDLPTMAGSSIHFDYAMLKAKMPDRNESSAVMKRFSHRHYDVSAVKLFCHSLGMPKIPRGEAHRVNADIQESIAHAKLCAEWLKTYGGPLA